MKSNQFPKDTKIKIDFCELFYEGRKMAEGTHRFCYFKRNEYIKEGCLKNKFKIK